MICDRLVEWGTCVYWVFLGNWRITICLLITSCPRSTSVRIGQWTQRQVFSVVCQITFVSGVHGLIRCDDIAVDISEWNESVCLPSHLFIVYRVHFTKLSILLINLFWMLFHMVKIFSSFLQKSNLGVFFCLLDNFLMFLLCELLKKSFRFEARVKYCYKYSDT